MLHLILISPKLDMYYIHHLLLFYHLRDNQKYFYIEVHIWVLFSINHNHIEYYTLAMLLHNHKNDKYYQHHMK